MKEFSRNYAQNMESGNNLDEEVSVMVEKMNFRRRSGNYLSELDIDRKVFYDENCQKAKFDNEFRGSSGELTLDLGIELAEMVYWASQKNASERVRLELEDCEDRLGISHQFAQELFLIKAKSEVNQSIGTNNKEVEELLYKYYFSKNGILVRG